MIAYIVGVKHPSKIVLPGDEVKENDKQAEQALKETLKAEVEQGVVWKRYNGRPSDINSKFTG